MCARMHIISRARYEKIFLCQYPFCFIPQLPVYLSGLSSIICRGPAFLQFLHYSKNTKFLLFSTGTMVNKWQFSSCCLNVKTSSDCLCCYSNPQDYPRLQPAALLEYSIFRQFQLHRFGYCYSTFWHRNQESLLKGVGRPQIFEYIQ